MPANENQKRKMMKRNKNETVKQSKSHCTRTKFQATNQCALNCTGWMVA